MPSSGLLILIYKILSIAGFRIMKLKISWPYLQVAFLSSDFYRSLYMFRSPRILHLDFAPKDWDVGHVKLTKVDDAHLVAV